MFTNLKNKLLGRYASHPEAIVISCFFNPMKSPYRLKAFRDFYASIEHLNHVVVECVIGNSIPQLGEYPKVERIFTESLLWHKEAILNGIIKKLDKKYKYVFWVDADVIFTNKNWLVEGVKELKTKNIIQPFEYCVHLGKDETKPSFNMYSAKQHLALSSYRQKELWRSFCAYRTDQSNCDDNYDGFGHGHVGFAWGAKRHVLDDVPLYDKALIGGADHIIAHAACGQISHKCIEKSFKDDSDNVYKWSKAFYSKIWGKIGYVQGDLYHLWHGDIEKRQYLKRIKDFTPKHKNINKKDNNGLYVSSGKEDQEYIRNYFSNREVRDDEFYNSMMYGYLLDDGIIGGALGGNFMGGMVGDMLNDSDAPKHAPLHSPDPYSSPSHSAPVFDLPLEKSFEGDIVTNSDTENFS